MRKGVGAGDGEGIVDVWRDGAGSMRRMASRSRGIPFGAGKRGLSARTCVVRNNGRKVAMWIGRMVEAGSVVVFDVVWAGPIVFFLKSSDEDVD